MNEANESMGQETRTDVEEQDLRGASSEPREEQAFKTRKEVSEKQGCQKSELKDLLKKGLIGIALVFVFLASFQLYFSIDSAIRIWFEYQYVPLLKAVYNMVVLLIAIYAVILYTKKEK